MNSFYGKDTSVHCYFCCWCLWVEWAPVACCRTVSFTDSPFFQWVCVDGHQFEFHMEPQFDNLSTFKGGLNSLAGIASNTATVEWPKVHQFLWKVKKSQWGSDKTLPVMVFVLTSFSINIFATFHFQSHTTNMECKPFQKFKTFSKYLCEIFLENLTCHFLQGFYLVCPPYFCTSMETERHCCRGSKSK